MFLLFRTRSLSTLADRRRPVEQTCVDCGITFWYSWPVPRCRQCKSVEVHRAAKRGASEGIAPGGSTAGRRIAYMEPGGAG